MITVNAEKCPQNHKCPSMAVCPQGAISQKDIYALPQVDQEKCVSCGKLLHLNCGMSEELLEHIEEVHRFKVDNGATVLYGLCADCRKDCPHQPALPLIPASAVCRHAHGGEER